MSDKRAQIESRVRVHLLTGKTITQEQCRELFNGWRLAVCIQRLKQKGLKIEKTMVKKNGVSFAKYFLADHPRFKNKTVTS